MHFEAALPSPVHAAGHAPSTTSSSSLGEIVIPPRGGDWISSPPRLQRGADRGVLWGVKGDGLPCVVEQAVGYEQPYTLSEVTVPIELNISNGP